MHSSSERHGAKCFIESNGKVNCSNIIYEDEKSWKKSRHQVDVLIQVLKNKIIELKGIRRHLKENKPKNITDDDFDLSETISHAISSEESDSGKSSTRFVKPAKRVNGTKSDHPAGKRPHPSKMHSNRHSTTTSENLLEKSESTFNSIASLSSTGMPATTSNAPNIKSVLLNRTETTPYHHNRKMSSNRTDEQSRKNHHTVRPNEVRKTVTRTPKLSSSTTVRPTTKKMPKSTTQLADVSILSTEAIAMTSENDYSTHENTVDEQRLSSASTDGRSTYSGLVVDERSKKTNSIEDKFGTITLK